MRIKRESPCLGLRFMPIKLPSEYQISSTVHDVTDSISYKNVCAYAGVSAGYIHKYIFRAKFFQTFSLSRKSPPLPVPVNYSIYFPPIISWNLLSSKKSSSSSRRVLKTREKEKKNSRSYIFSLCQFKCESSTSQSWMCTHRHIV